MDGVKRMWRRHVMRRRNDEPSREHRADGTTAGRVRFSLLAKITLFLVVILIPLAAVSWIIAYRSLQDNLTREFTDKGSAIANSLASSGADLIVNRDASTVQQQCDQFAKINAVDTLSLV